MHYRQLRGQLSVIFRREAAISAAEHLVSQPLFQQSQHIGCYLSYHHELDPEPLIRQIWSLNKKCYLPQLTPEKSLQFACYEEGDPLFPNQYGILEPLKRAEQIRAEELDLVVVPLVAFDRAGHRLGMGGGYYDRTFGFLMNEERKKPKLIGYAYDIQRAEMLPVDEWDVMLDGVVTERGWMVCHPEM